MNAHFFLSRRRHGLLAVVVLTSASCTTDRPAFVFDADRPSAVMSEMATAVPVGGSAALIDEADFRAALGARRPAAGSAEAMSVATRVASLANSPAALGVFSEIDPERTTFSGDLFVVVRDPGRGLRSGFVEAQDFYLAKVRLSGRARWVGRNPYVALDSDLPLPTGGNCGLLEASGGRLPCPGPNCPPQEFRSGVSSGDGARRGGVLGTSRVPLHVLDPSGFSLWLCQPFEFVPADRPLQGLEPAGNTERCNGFDDDGDGSIDEGGVCANRLEGCRTAALTTTGNPLGRRQLPAVDTPSCQGE